MSRIYSSFFVIVAGISLFAMDNKDFDPNNSKQSVSYHMEPKLSIVRENKETGETTHTYTYSDGSKSSYITYENSSVKKNMDNSDSVSQD